MRLSRVSVQMAGRNDDGNGSAWIVVLTTRQGGDRRQDSVGFDAKVSTRATFCLRVWHVATRSRVQTPP